MTSLVMAEIISAVFVLVSLISMFREHDRAESTKKLRFCTALTFLWLIVDAVSYLIDGPAWSPVLVKAVNLAAFSYGGLILISFMDYCDAYISEKCRLNPWMFRVPAIAMGMAGVAIILYFTSGDNLSVVDGYIVYGSGIPMGISVVQIVLILFVPGVAFTKRKDIGMKAAILLGTFSIAPIGGILLAAWTGEDYTVVLTALAIIIVVTLLQKDNIQLQLENARKTAEEANKAKTSFLFSMSHDIRTPLNAILGFADIALRHGDDPEKVQDSLKKIKSSGGHLLSLVNDVLEMSRIESGRMELSEDPMDIRDVIEEVSQMSRALAASRNIDFRTEFGNIGTPYLQGDELRVSEILINIISNAVKYTNEGGSVRFRVEQVGSSENGIVNYRFAVADNGIGMSEEFQRHLFEGFSRENSSVVSRQEGTGLGLAIVKKIVDLAGGSIRVQSRKGEGSVFTVVLPMKVMTGVAQRAFLDAREKPEEIGRDSSFDGKKVLLVEDNVLNREIAEEILKDMGLTVETAENGEIAVRMVDEKGIAYYDYILMDIQMPVMDGHEAAREIRRKYPDSGIPIIALSANAFAEDRIASRAAGMNDHIAKPVNVNELLNCLAKYSA